LVTRKERSDFPSANHYQGQVQTPQSLSVNCCGARCFQFNTDLQC